MGQFIYLLQCKYQNADNHTRGSISYKYQGKSAMNYVFLTLFKIIEIFTSIDCLRSHNLITKL